MMRKIILSLALIAGFGIVNAQSLIFEDDFDSYEDFIIEGVGNWIMYDMDLAPTYSYTGDQVFPNQFDPKAFMVFNPSQADGATNSSGGEENRNFDPQSGEKYMASWASVDVPNDDYMVSPAFTLGGSGNELSFFVKSLSNTYGYEEYNYYVYTGSGVPNVEDLVWEGGDVANSWETWMEINVNLDAYAGQTIRFAVQCVSNDAYMFMVDSMKVFGNLGVSDLSTDKSAIYPNPVKDVLNIRPGTKFDASTLKVKITDMTGKTVMALDGSESYDVSRLPSGVYVVEITDGMSTERRKLIKN